ncbi:MAG: type II toxin-antitoxin system RelE family toxin [Dongiaceae bacterium]
MRVVFTVAAAKHLARLPRRTMIAIDDALARLALDPRDPAADVKRLQGRSDYRLRVGDCRVIFSWQPPDTLVVMAVGSRQSIYRR